MLFVAEDPVSLVLAKHYELTMEANVWRKPVLQCRFSVQKLAARGTILFLLGLIAGACLGSVNDMTIFSGEFLTGPEGVRFDFEQPLQRTREALSIRVDIDGEWEPEPPWDTILMQDGRRIRISASLVATDGRVFDSALIGSAGGLDLRFLPPPPRDVSIIAFILKTDLPIRCRDVKWHEYNPI